MNVVLCRRLRSNTLVTFNLRCRNSRISEKHRPLRRRNVYFNSAATFPGSFGPAVSDSSVGIGSNAAEARFRNSIHVVFCPEVDPISARQAFSGSNLCSPLRFLTDTRPIRPFLFPAARDQAIRINRELSARPGVDRAGNAPRAALGNWSWKLESNLKQAGMAVSLGAIQSGG